MQAVQSFKNRGFKFFIIPAVLERLDRTAKIIKSDLNRGKNTIAFFKRNTAVDFDTSGMHNEIAKNFLTALHHVQLKTVKFKCLRLRVIIFKNGADRVITHNMLNRSYPRTHELFINSAPVFERRNIALCFRQTA